MGMHDTLYDDAAMNRLLTPSSVIARLLTIFTTQNIDHVSVGMYNPGQHAYPGLNSLPIDAITEAIIDHGAHFYIDHEPSPHGTILLTITRNELLTIPHDRLHQILRSRLQIAVQTIIHRYRQGDPLALPFTI